MLNNGEINSLSKPTTHKNLKAAIKSIKLTGIFKALVKAKIIWIIGVQEGFQNAEMVEKKIQINNSRNFLQTLEKRCVQMPEVQRLPDKLTQPSLFQDLIKFSLSQMRSIKPV